MDNIKEFYKQLKEREKQLETYLFLNNFKLTSSSNYSKSENQAIDAEMLHEFVEFVQKVLDEFDSEPTTPALLEMKNKIIRLFATLITKIEANKIWGAIIEKDIDIEERKGYVRLIHSTKKLASKGRLLSIQSQIKYLYNLLVVVSDDLQEPIQAPELPPIDATLKSAANYVVLLHDLGILKHLKTQFNELSAQRIGELCGLITGHKTDYFREAISSANPEKTRAFTPAGRREVESQLVKFGIEKQGKKGKL